MTEEDALFRQAVEEHAQYLGMDLQLDKDYFQYVNWHVNRLNIVLHGTASIAEQALTAPLPEGWQQGLTDDGTPYHFNEETGESMWEHPMDGHYKEMFQKAKQKKETNAQAKKEEPDIKASDDIEVADFDEDDEFEFG